MKTLRHFYLLLFLSCIFPFNADAQTGEIQGKVTDAETGETLPFVNISIEVDGNLVGTTTDFDGIYSITSIPVGVYNLTFSYVGFQTLKIEEIEVQKDKRQEVNCSLSYVSEIIDDSYQIICPTIPLINSSETRLGIIITRTRSGSFDVHNIY